jgi:hypothetical protein
MSFKDLPPEKLQEMRAKGLATRLAKKAQAEADRVSLAVNSRELDEPQADRRGDVEEVIPAPEIVYGEIAESEPAAGLDANDPFSLFLISLDAETKELLSLDELRDIYAVQVAKALAEKKSAKKKAASELAAKAARMEAGLVPMATREAMETTRRNAELVRFTVELPPAGDRGEVADIGLRVDQKVFLHGHTYTLTRAQYDSFRDTLYRAGEHELTFKGQNRRQRQWLLGRALGSVDRHIPLNEDGSLA